MSIAASFMAGSIFGFCATIGAAVIIILAYRDREAQKKARRKAERAQKEATDRLNNHNLRNSSVDDLGEVIADDWSEIA